MVIAFVVLAIVALVFLFIYNSRLTKKSARAEEARKVPPEASTPLTEPAAQLRPAEPAEIPAAAETLSESRPRAAVPQAPDRTALVEAETEAHRSASEGDRAYREALRKFAVQTPASAEQAAEPVHKPDPSSDAAYREALRSMMKDQKK